MNLDDIDFAALYRGHMQRHRLVPKPASAWDGRAADYGRPQAPGSGGGYVQDFIARLDLRGVRSVLDIGCGPGTLALPLAARVEQVTALDYSEGMLQQLQERAREAGLSNIRALHRAWEDDWSDLPVHDLVVASRSTTVDDLDAALRKMARHARLRACFTYPADGHFIGRDILQALQISLPAVPDVLLALGMLRRMGILPRLDCIEMPSRLAGCATYETFEQRVLWSTGPLDEAARQRLREWFEADAGRAARGGGPMRWAFVSWEVAPA